MAYQGKRPTHTHRAVAPRPAVSTVSSHDEVRQSSSSSVSTFLTLILGELRPCQWVKNLLIFVAFFFACFGVQEVQNSQTIILTLFDLCKGFILFCMASSSVYVLNDLHDLSQDRQHSVKRLRPLASGRLSTKSGWQCASVMLGATLIGCVLVNEPVFYMSIGLYFIIQLLYTVFFKQIIGVGLFVLSSGFVLRVIAGGWISGVYISPWLVLCVFMLALFVMLCKRRWNLLYGKYEPPSQMKSQQREQPYATTSRYAKPVSLGVHRDGILPSPSKEENSDLTLIDLKIGIMAASTIVCYALYTLSYATITRYDTEWLVATVPFVMLGVFRYLRLVYVLARGGRPECVFPDLGLLLIVLCWGVSCGMILFFAT